MATESPISPRESRSLSGRTLSLEIEPSYPLLNALIQFFRDQKQPRHSLELCRMGLHFFPGDHGLRLKKVLAHLDLGETAQAREELEGWSAEWTRLAPILEVLSRHPCLAAEGPLQEWMDRLSQSLLGCPLTKDETAFPYPEGPSSPAPEAVGREEGQGLAGEGEGSSPPSGSENGGDANVLATLNRWLDQLKGNRT